MSEILLKNLTKANITFDKGTYCEYEFILGKLYGFKQPKFYSSSGTMTFYNAENLFNVTSKKSFTSHTTNFIGMQEIMLYVGHLVSTCIPPENLYIHGYLNVQIPCFFYKNSYMIPEYFIANNPTTFFLRI